MRVKADCSREGRKAPTRAPTGSGQVRGAAAGRKGRLVIGDGGTDDSRPAFPGRAPQLRDTLSRAFARKGRQGRQGRKALTRAPTGSGQVRGADAGRKGRLVSGDWGLGIGDWLLEIWDWELGIRDWRTDGSRPAVPGRAPQLRDTLSRAFAHKGRQAPTRVRGADAGRRGLFFWSEKSFANVADLA